MFSLQNDCCRIPDRIQILQMNWYIGLFGHMTLILIVVVGPDCFSPEGGLTHFDEYWASKYTGFFSHRADEHIREESANPNLKSFHRWAWCQLYCFNISNFIVLFSPFPSLLNKKGDKALNEEIFKEIYFP